MPDEKQAEHWAQKKERGSSMGIMFLLYSFKYLGAVVCKLFMTPVLLYFFLFNTEARKNLSQYLTQLNQFDKKSPPANLWQVLKIYFNFGFGIVDRMSAWQGHIKKFKMSKINNEVFLNLRTANKGAVIVVSHLGNFEMSRMAAGDDKGAVFNVFMHTKNAKKFAQVIKKFNPEYAVSLIQGDELNIQTAIMLKEKIDAGEFVVIAGDRVPVENEGAVVVADFLGKPANFAIGPYVLAKVLACPLIGMFCLKSDSGYQVIFESYADQVIFNRKNRSDVLQGYAQKYAQSIERQLKIAPLQWYNFHDFWDK